MTASSDPYLHRLPRRSPRAAAPRMLGALAVSALAVSISVSVSVSRAGAAPLPVTATEGDDTITVTAGGRPVLVYHKSVVPPPEGSDPLFARSGFIHPLTSPGGAPLSGIHPDDHIHHLGLWHAWVNTTFEGREVDFWNLLKGLGTVRYGKTLEVEEDAGSFAVEQEHVAFAPEGETGETVVLRERFEIRVTAPDPETYLVDYTTSQTNVGSSPLTLPAYRYGGGIAYRSPLWWQKENSDYLSSEGKTRVDGHTTRSRWCAMWGPPSPDEGTTGAACIAILCHPQNHDAPQRMRVWPDGRIFYNYVPIQETGWEIAPDETAVMRYRLVLTDQRPDPEAIDSAWEAFAAGR